MQGNQARDTRPEIRVRSALHRSGLRFRKHARPVPELRCQADVVFPREKIAVFIDGCFWHGCPEHANVPHDSNGYWVAKLGRNIERDLRNNKALAVAGWLVLRYWEHEDASKVAVEVRAAILAQRAAGHSPSKRR